MNNISNAIKCVNCESTLISPVLLPCGHSVCKNHASNNVNPCIRCGSCGQDHYISPNCFPENKALSLLIESEIGKLDFGSFYKKAKTGCSELNDLHVEIEALLKDPSFFTHQKISDLKNTIQIKSEEFKLQIDKEVDELLEKLKRYEADCKEYSTTNSYIDKAKSLDMSLKESELKLKHWNDSLNKLFIDESKWKTIIEECDKTKESLLRSFETLKESLLLNTFDLIESNVKFRIKIDFENIIEYKSLNIESNIIQLNELKEFYELLEIHMDQKWNLLYRATRDGFDAADFHAKCDGKSKTLVIVKATSGNVFGGYTECTWDQSGMSKKGDRDYIFSYRNKLNKKLKIRKFIYDSIFCSTKYGPVFGLFDFIIADSSDTNESSSSDLGYSFQHPQYSWSSDEAKSFLAGSENFRVDEIEVFQFL